MGTSNDAKSVKTEKNGEKNQKKKKIWIIHNSHYYYYYLVFNVHVITYITYNMCLFAEHFTVYMPIIFTTTTFSVELNIIIFLSCALHFLLTFMTI